MPYFNNLGYQCPAQVDEADFLQVLPTPEGRKYAIASSAPKTTEELARAWKESDLFHELASKMRHGPKVATDLEKAIDVKPVFEERVWPKDVLEKHPQGFWFYFVLCVKRQMTIVTRDSTFAKSRIGQSLLVGAISGSLFSNIETTDITTMNGFLFNTMLFGALGSFALLPIVYEQKAVFYKQADALFFPTSAYTLAQAVSMFPLQILENMVYITIVYWSAGLSSEYNGSRFLTFILLSFAFSNSIAQLFRLIAAVLPDARSAMPFAGK
jgi:hypothetical protein